MWKQHTPAQISRLVPGIVALFLVLGACASTDGEDSGESREAGESGDPHPVNLVTVPNFLQWPGYVAFDLGFFEDEGLDVEIIEAASGDELRAALLGGSADICVCDMAGGAVLHQSQPIVNLVGITNQKGTQLLVSTEHEAEVGTGDPSKLEGLAIAITSPGSGTDLILRAFLTANGLDPEADIEITPVGGVAESLTAMKEGLVDAMVSLEPVTTIALDKEKSAYLFSDFGDDPDLFPQGADILESSAYTLKSYYDDNPGVVEGLTRALVRAHIAIQTDPEGVIDSATRLMPDEDEELIRAVIERHSVKYGPHITDEGWTATLEPLVNDGTLKAMVPYEEVVPDELAALWEEYDTEVDED